MPNWTDRPPTPLYGLPCVDVRALRKPRKARIALVVAPPPERPMIDFVARLGLSRRKVAEARERMLRPYLTPGKGA